MRVKYCWPIQAWYFSWSLHHGSQMKVLRLLSAVIVLQIASAVVHSSASHGRGEFSRSKRLATANNNTCSIQQLKSIHGAILKRPKKGNNSSVARGEKVEFVCKDGYRQVDKLKSFVCQGDGNWTESSPKQNGRKDLKFCINARLE